MNSWHSWSPNGKWLVFSSKAGSAYTQLYLTHIDEQGHSTPPVWLAHFTAPDRAANIPEFVNSKPTAIKKIREQFLNDYSFVRAGNEFFRAGDADKAISEYREALKLNPNNFQAHYRLGFLLYNVTKEYEQGMAHYAKAIRINPDDPRINYDLGMALGHQGKHDQAIGYLSASAKRMPGKLDLQYNLADVRYNLGLLLFHQRRFKEAAANLSEAVHLEPKKPDFHYKLALTLAALGKIDETVAHYSKAVSFKGDVDKSPMLHELLGANYARAGRFREAITSATRALNLARAAGDEQLALQIARHIEIYKQEHLAQQLRQGLAPPQPK
jgi:tetratricopeptide (TPR) repeat protein